MFLYSSKHALSLSTDIISPMTTSDQINYNNYHAELGLFKFLISVYFSQNYENRCNSLGNAYPSASPLVSQHQSPSVKGWLSLATES